VVIAGAGVAGIEAMIALRSLAGQRVEITLVAPTAEFVYRPLSVAEPFDIDHARRYPLQEIASDFNATFVENELSWVGPRSQRAFLGGGDEMGYDALVLALGANAYPAWPHVSTFGGPRDVEMLRELNAEVERAEVASLAFVVPPGVTWAFPLYELALLTASLARHAGVEMDLVLFTPESSPLEVFGGEASAEVAAQLKAAGVRFCGGRSVTVMRDGDVLASDRDEPQRFDRVLAVPRLEGPAPRGIPCDDEGFIPIDSHGLVHHVDHVYAAGDGTNFPVKQGGIASQQADAVAEVIAKRSGARVDPRPIRPVLRGHLLGNGWSRFLRGDLHPRDHGVSEVSLSTMWWPAGKIASTYLSPYLAELDRNVSGAGRPS
jgi:sulfide:quinone oxidoreductase